MMGEPWMVQLVINLPELQSVCWYLAEIFLVLVVCGLLLKARRIIRAGRGQGFPKTATKSNIWIKRVFEWLVGALWSVIETLYKPTQLLIRLIYLPGGAVPAATNTISTLATTLPEAEHRATEGELQDQQKTETELKSTIKEEPQPDVDIPLVIFHLSQMWNRSSLKEGKRNMKACFNREDLHHQFKSLFSLNHGVVHFIDHSSLFELDGIIRQFRIVEPRYRVILYKIFSDNSDFLDRCFCNFFNSAGLSTDIWTSMDASQFNCQSTKNCVMIMKIAAALLCFMGNELDKAACKYFDQDLRNYYFSVCAKRPIENLIQTADLMSNLKLSAHQIYQMLVLYEAIVDVLSAFGHPSEYNRILWQMQYNFKRVFDGIKCVICDKLHGRERAIMCVRHPATNFLVKSMKLFKNHSSIVQLICVGDGSCTLGSLLSEVISFWSEELEKYSAPEKLEKHTRGSNYVFLLNNLNHFIWEIKCLLKVLIPNSECVKILGSLESLINKYTFKYLDDCWGPVRGCVELNFECKPRFSSLREFKVRFNAIHEKQRTWELETRLKEKLQGDIEGFITPSYEAFLERLQMKVNLCVGLVYQGDKYMTPGELKERVKELFESEYTERIL